MNSDPAVRRHTVASKFMSPADSASSSRNSTEAPQLLCRLEDNAPKFVAPEFHGPTVAGPAEYAVLAPECVSAALAAAAVRLRPPTATIFCGFGLSAATTIHCGTDSAHRAAEEGPLLNAH